ncbi:MAG: DUF3786 domain-containing protein [Oscillospiraceae bacterium]|nr:DUF3786 domain-containing protein [Oscillospiraceae bacterium]
MNNYEVSRDRAQAYFLSFDQQQIIRTWKLHHDADYLYVDFLNIPYQICRKTGAVFRCSDHQQAGFEEVLSIFDLLCHEGSSKQISGNFAPVNSLKSRPRAIGVGTDFHEKIAAEFDRNPQVFQKACLAMGAVPVALGDMGFRFRVFGPLDVIIKFYHADEEFPASVTLLWDDQTLQFLFYETVFYIAGFLLHSILEQMKQH